MTRFKHKPLEPIAEVTVADEKSYRETFEVPTPVGKYFGDIAITLIEIVNEFGSRMDDPASQAKATVDAFTYLRGRTDFWKELLPAVLGFKSVKGKSMQGEKDLIEYFEDNCTDAEVVTVFMEAAAHIVNYSMGAEETEEALAKSGGGEAGEGEVNPPSDGSMPQA